MAVNSERRKKITKLAKNFFSINKEDPDYIANKNKIYKEKISPKLKNPEEVDFFYKVLGELVTANSVQNHQSSNNIKEHNIVNENPNEKSDNVKISATSDDQTLDDYKSEIDSLITYQNQVVSPPIVNNNDNSQQQNQNWGNWFINLFSRPANPHQIHSESSYSQKNEANNNTEDSTATMQERLSNIYTESTNQNSSDLDSDKDYIVVNFVKEFSPFYEE